MTIYGYITGGSFPITLEGVIEDIMDGLITVRGVNTGCKVNMGNTPEEVEKNLRRYLFEGEVLTDDEHAFFVVIR